VGPFNRASVPLSSRLPKKLIPPTLNAITARMKLVRKTEVWRPTRWGFLLILMLLTILGLGLSRGLYPFLAQHRPLPQADLVIIEGWMPDAELIRMFEGLEPGALLVTTGGPIKMGGSLLDDKTYADMSATRLRKLGVPAESIVSAPAPDVDTDRTYASAQAVYRVLEERDLVGLSANLYSLGPHSRRSFFLYKKVFGAEAPLGVVSLESEEFDLRRWWRSSYAFKSLLTELTSWFYVQGTRWKY